MPDAVPLQKKLNDIVVDLHTLDSKISLIAQKIKMIEKNEEVIGRTIVMHNEKLRGIESAQASTPSDAVSQAAGAESARLDQSQGADIEELKRQVAALKAQAVSRKEFSELRYTLDSINPLEFITVAQARALIEEEVAKRSGKKPGF